jgi:lipoprotein-releasing system ATP-binding protein
MAACLELKAVSKQYGSGDTLLSVLKHINLSIEPGEIVALMAPSGAGKSTLLHIAGLLDQPTTGDVFINGQNTCNLPRDQLSFIRAQSLGFVYQFHHLLPEFNSVENIVLPQLLLNVPEKKAIQNAHKALSHFGLEKRAEHRPNQLSGGEQQRVAIARALANNPQILLADEPTGNLDLQTGDLVFNALLSHVKKTGLACLIATHNEALAKRMDKIITIKDGHLQQV